MSNPQFYPRWITRPDGARIVVQNHLEHSSHMGEDFDEDASPVVRRPAPPALEEILSVGYVPVTAEVMFQREAAKAAQGIEPYGDKPLADFIQPVLTISGALKVAGENLLAIIGTHDASLGEAKPDESNVVEIPAPPATVEPEEDAFTEPFYPPAEIDEPETTDVPFDLDTPIDLDPLGLFEPPTEAEATETAAPRRRRKKAETGA